MKKEKKHISITGYTLTTIGLAIVVIGVIFLSVSLIRQIRNLKDSAQASDSSMTGIEVMDASADENETDQETAAAYTGKKVLFISSYDPTSAYYEDQINGVLSISDKYGIEFDVRNMDVYKHNSTADQQLFTEQIRQTVSEENYDGVIAADDAALYFVREHQDEFFAGLPIVFFGVNDHAYGRLAASNPHITGYLESNYIEEVLEMALDLLPDTEQFVFISDSTRAGNAGRYEAELLAADDAWQDKTFTFLDYSSLSTEALQQQLSAYTDGTVIIDISASVGADGNYQTAAESSRLISAAANVPVFRTNKGGFGNGVCGGCFADMQTTAAQAAELMYNVIDQDMDLSTVGVREDNTVEYTASYTVMKKYGLNVNDLPEDTIVIGQPETFNSRFGSVFYPMLLIVAGLLLISAGAHSENKSRARTAEQLTFALEHDPLTGLYNRQAALQKVNEDPRMKEDRYAVVLLDIDDFQEINETYGHDNGDLILREIALELQSLAQSRNASIFRYGGDEFVLVFYGCHLDEQDEVIERIMKVFRKERTIGFDTIHPYGSAGIANGDKKADPTEMILEADLALKRSKQRGKDIATLYSDDLSEMEDEREKIKAKVLDAIENDGLYMLYQPQVNTQDGTLCGFEALVRMKNGGIGPGVFIPIAEENGWIRAIGRRTAEMTIAQIASWRKAGLTPPPVSINYSAGQLSDTSYVSFLTATLQKYDVPAEAIHLEITERMAMSNEDEVYLFFDAVQRAGISLHMDDFGTGYSSFSALSYIPVDVVKIDKSLVDAYLNKESSRVFRDIVDMLKGLQKHTIVEGVETAEQCAMLKKFGADAIQGYYFGRPASAEEAEVQIRTHDLTPEK